VTIVRDKKGQFAKGWRGGPGRRPGQRNRLTEIAIAALTDHFAVHGEAAIDRVYREDPVAYLAMITRLMPRQVQKLEGPLSDISDTELDAIEQHLRELRAGNIRRLELLELQPAPAAAEPIAEENSCVE